MIKKGQEVCLEISDVAFGGRGLAKISEFVVFVDKALQGDLIKAMVTKKKKNYAEARLLEVVTPSEYRIAAACDYSGVCGGCTFQYMDYERQLYFKTRHVKEALSHIALMDDVPVKPALRSEKIFEYRNKMEFTCSPDRWLMPHELGVEGIERGMGIGFHAPKSFQKIIDIKKCHIMPDDGNRILETVRTYIASSGEPAYDQRNHTGFWRFVTLRHSVSRDSWMVNLVTSSENDEILNPLASVLSEKFKNIASVVNNITAKKAGVAFGEYEKVLYGDDHIVDRIGDFEFMISPNSFFQTNTRGAETLYSLVLQYAELTGSETVVDLYCGAGTISLWLSGHAKKVIGAEIVESAINDAKKNAALNSIENCFFYLGDVARILPSVEKMDVMVVDPPRTGMHKDVIRQVIEMAPDRIVYVSCNPATMARDFLELKQYYRICEVQPVDMFPHTYHIEAVAKLERI